MSLRSIERLGSSIRLHNRFTAHRTKATGDPHCGRTREAAMGWPGRPGYWLLLLVALGACGGKGSEEIKKVQALTRRLAEIAGQANQAAPAMVDPDTRLDSARAGPGLKLTSTYTLVNAESNGVDSTTFEAKLAPIIKSASCDNPDLRPLIDQGVVVVLEYHGNQGNPIGTVTVNRDTCGALK